MAINGNRLQQYISGSYSDFAFECCSHFLAILALKCPYSVPRIIPNGIEPMYPQKPPLYHFNSSTRPWMNLAISSGEYLRPFVHSNLRNITFLLSLRELIIQIFSNDFCKLTLFSFIPQQLLAHSLVVIHTCNDSTDHFSLEIRARRKLLFGISR